tara:strand:- start:1960 stop:2598 length:639 start_codon:yes stop_codon:yes gene_type:complete
MGIRDRNIDWLRRKKIIPAVNFGFSGTIPASTDSGGGTITTLGTGAPVITEVSSFGFAGLNIGAALDMGSYFDLEFPSVADPTEEIGVRCLWAPNAAVSTSDRIQFSVQYDQVDVGEAISAASTSLDTVLVTQGPSATTAFLLHRTSRGIIDANKFDFTARQGGIIWEINAATWTGFEATDVIFLGLELDYIPLLCANTEEDVDVHKDQAAT